MFDGFVKNLDLLRWFGFKGKPKAVRNPHGYTKTTGPHGEVVDCDTLQCGHCGAHWEVVVGSGRERGFCRRCMNYVCGQAECMVACAPFEQKLDNMERGLPRLTPTPAMSMPCGLSGGVLLTPKAAETDP